MNTTQHTMHYSNNSTALRKDGTFGQARHQAFGKALAMALLAILTLATPAALRAQNEPEVRLNLSADYSTRTLSAAVQNGALGTTYWIYYGTDDDSPSVSDDFTFSGEPYLDATHDLTSTGIDVAGFVSGTEFHFVAFAVTLDGNGHVTAATVACTADYTLERYLVPTLTRSGNTLTLANPNTENENTVGSLYYYTGNNTPQTYSSAITATDNTEYHFFVSGAGKFRSPELVTTVRVGVTLPDPNSTDPINISEDKVQESITNNNAQYPLYYKLFDTQQNATEAANTVDWTATARSVASNDNLSVTAAEDGQAYLFAYLLTREERVMLGTATIGDPRTVVDAVGTTRVITIERYAAPVVTPNYRSLHPTISASLATTDQSNNNDAYLKWISNSIYNNAIPTNQSNPENNTTTTSVSISISSVDANGNVDPTFYNNNYGFRTFGASKYPTSRSQTVIVSSARYNTAAILDYTPYEQNVPASGTFVAPEGTVAYINYSSRSNDVLVDPDPSQSGTYNITIPAGGTFPESFNSTTFKMVTSVANGTTPAAYPSEVVTVGQYYSGYYTIHHYDATTGLHHYFSLDSAAIRSSASQKWKDKTTFDYSSLWFCDENHRLFQIYNGERYYLNWIGSTGSFFLRYSLSVSTESNGSVWNFDEARQSLSIPGRFGTIPFSSNPIPLPYCLNYSNSKGWNVGLEGYPSVIFPVEKRIARAQTYKEVEDVAVEPIWHVHSAEQTDQPYWFTMVDQSTATLKARVTGKVRTYQLPAHFHYTFNPGNDAGGQQDFTFYKGVDGNYNRSYPIHTKLPARVLQSEANLGSQNASQASITFEWYLMDGLSRYPVSMPNAQTSIQWGDGQTGNITSLSGLAKEMVGDATEYGTVPVGSKLTMATGNNNENTISLASLSDRSARSDTLYVKATVSFPNTDLAGASIPSIKTATSRRLLANYGNQVGAPTVRNNSGSPETFQDGHIYLMTSCSDRTLAYDDRHYLTGDPDHANAYFSNQTSYYRAFRFDRVGTTGNVYTIYNIGLNKYLSCSETNDRFDLNNPAVQYVTVAESDVATTTSIHFEIIPFTEADDNTYNMILPVGHGTGVSIVPVTGSANMDDPTSTASGHTNLNGATLRLGNGIYGVQKYTDNNGSTERDYAFDASYYYGAYWQLIVPTMLPPEIAMDPTGKVTIADHEGAIRGTRAEVRYQRTTYDEVTHTWSWPTAIEDINGSTGETPNYSVYTSTSNIVLAEGQSIRAWKVGVDGTDAHGAYDYTYLHDSPVNTFKAVRVNDPRLDAIDNSITFTLPTTDVDGNSLADRHVHVKYTCYNANMFPDPDEDEQGNPIVRDLDPLTTSNVNVVTYSVPSDEVAVSCTITYRAFADNCLASEPVPYNHTARLTLTHALTTDGKLKLNIGANTPHDAYRIYYTTDGSAPLYNPEAQTSNGKWYNSTDNNLSETGIAIPSGTTIVRARAFAVDGRYTSSVEVRYYTGGGYLTFCHVDNPGATNAQHMDNDDPYLDPQTGVTKYHNPDNDFNFMLINYEYGIDYYQTGIPRSINMPDHHQAFSSHALDSTVIFRGHALGEGGQDKPIFNGVTGAFLDYREQDGVKVPYVRTVSQNYPTPRVWTWGGEQTASDANESAAHYTLTTVIGGTTYYLVYVDNNADYPWQLVSDINPEHVHAKVAFRTDLVNYPGGHEFSAKGKNLFMEETLPDGTKQWVPLDTLDNAWMAYATNNETVRLRTSFKGNYIDYHSNIDINIHRYEYDDQGHAEDDFDQYVPWQQWHQFTPIFDESHRKSEYCHYYMHVPGFRMHWEKDYIDPCTRRDPVSGQDIPLSTFTWTLNGTNYYKFVDANGADIMDATNTSALATSVTGETVTLKRCGNLSDGNPDLSTLLTLHSQHYNAYDNEGAPFDQTVKVRLFAEQTISIDMTNMFRARVAAVSKAYSNPEQYWSIFPGTEVTTASLGDKYQDYYFLTGQPTMGVGPSFTKRSVWYLTNDNMYVHFHNLGYEDYAIYYRPDLVGGIYLVNPDENQDPAFYAYMNGKVDENGHVIVPAHAHNPLEMEESLNLNFWMSLYGQSGAQMPSYVCLTPNNAVNNQSYALTCDNDWRKIKYGAGEVTAEIAAMTEDAKETALAAACQTDFWKRRWRLDMSAITPPDIAMDPSGNVTLTHPLQTTGHLTEAQRNTVNSHLELYYKIITIPSSFPADDYDDATTWLNGYAATNFWTGASLYDPVNHPVVLREGETLIAGTWLRDENVTPDVEAALLATGYPSGFLRKSNKIDYLTAEKTPTPGDRQASSPTAHDVGGREGDHIVLGINRDPGTLKWTDEGADFIRTDDWYVKGSDLASLINSGNIITAIAWRENELQSDEAVYAKSQELTLAVTGYEISGTNVTISGTLATSSDFRPQSGYYKLYYNFNGAIATASDGTEIMMQNVTSAGRSKISFTITLQMPSGNAPNVHLKVFPQQTDFYKASNEVSQYLISSTYANPPSGNGTQAEPYQIANSADLFAVSNLINNNTAPATGKTAYNVAWYKVTADIDMQSIPFTSIGVNADNKKFAGHWNGGYKVVSHLDVPLFDYCDGGHVYNVVLDDVNINVATANAYVGALVSNASGASRIYNSGVRATKKSTVTGAGITGGLVGYLGGTSRVINCYNFADVTSTANNAAGIVGYQQYASTAQSGGIQGMVFNTLSYGEVHSTSGTVTPTVGGNFTTNDLVYNNAPSDKNINSYNYFLFGTDYKKRFGNKVGDEYQINIAYNAALAAEKRFLERFEFFRLMMNSNREKCGWWVTGTYSEYTNVATINEVAYADTIGKWVLDKSIAPYPVVLPKYDVNGNAIQYASIINPDYESPRRAADTCKAYQGRVIKEMGYRDNNNKPTGKLKVTINAGQINGSAVTGLTLATGVTNPTFVSITDIDTLNFDYNYGKIQLPYFQDIYRKGSNIKTVSSQDYIVTGWEITSVTGGTAGSFSTSGDNAYNFADRNCTAKDLYNTSGRVFAQGGYYNVPEGVTEITIKAHWGRAIYLRDTKYEKTYSNFSSNNVTAKEISDALYGSPSTAKINDQTVKTTFFDAMTAVSDNAASVYDNAIVLVSNFMATAVPYMANKKFTVMSVDMDNDHEPDYNLLVGWGDRNKISPIRFDYINVPAIGMVVRKNTTTSLESPMLGIDQPDVHFEITETALARYEQFEYYNAASGNATRKVALILNGGVIEQFVTAKERDCSTTRYIHLGGHVWFKMFSPGIHGDKQFKTYHCPVTVTGGEYESFYLSGMFRPDAPVNPDNPCFYANGGKFGHYASGGQEQIDGNVTVKVDHIIADEFYGGGINANNPITGNITVTINNSLVGIYAGGPKFGDMQTGKKVETFATGTTFGTFYGAGIGGTSLNKHRTGQDEPNTLAKFWHGYDNTSGTSDEKYKTYYAIAGTTDYPGYVRGRKVSYTSNEKNYGGIVVDYEMDDLFYSGGRRSRVLRFYQLEASFSKANTNNVTSELTDCIIKNDYFGGGFVGVVNGKAKSTLTNCTVHGNVFAGGNQAAVDTLTAYSRLDVDNKAQIPEFIPALGLVVPAHQKQADSIRCVWTHTDANPSNWIEQDGDVYVYKIYTREKLDDLGQCASTELIIDGETRVYSTDNDNGKVFGGGNAAPVHGTASVTVKDNAFVESDVFGGGNVAAVEGTCTVQIGEAKGNGANETYVEHRPWIMGDVYGGGNEADIHGGTKVTIYEGIMGPVYGGGNEGSVLHIKNTNGTIKTQGNTEVEMLGGYVGYRPKGLAAMPTENATFVKTIEPYYHSTDTSYWDFNNLYPVKLSIGRDRAYYGVFGGGFGEGTIVEGTATVKVGKATSMNNDIYVYGSVYGGGEAGQVGGGYKPISLTAGANIPQNTYYVFGSDGYPSVASGTVQANTDYYELHLPTFAGGTTVTVASDGTKTVNIAGAVFGGGRGYYVNMVENEEGSFEGSEAETSLAMAGAVYGNTNLTIGVGGQNREKIKINTIEYFTDKEKAAVFGLVHPNSLTSDGVFWKENLYVFDLDKQNYRPVTPGGTYEEINVQDVDGNSMKMNISYTDVLDGVQYYLETGRTSAVGGGERGPVYGSTVFNSSGQLQKHSDRSAGTMTGGNTTVTLVSGTLGGADNGEVDGCVYGGGLQATVDGTSTVNVSATASTTQGDSRKASESLWVRGDVYAGGCMGQVYNYANAPVATTQNLTGGWVRNAHGGSNIVEHNSRGNSKIVVGVLNGDNDDLLVSESVYGANGFSPSDGTATVEVHSGKVGYVYALVDINTTNTDDKPEASDAVGEEGDEGKIVINHQGTLAYEGNVYGGGFGPYARVKNTTVTVDGGIIRDGVFGGGEAAAVYEAAQESDNGKLTYIHELYNNEDPACTTYYKAQQGNVTSVTINGGQMSMVCGGGRGYTDFLQSDSYTPGAVMGNAAVTINGGTIDNENYHVDYGGGNVYGGGLEGIVTGNTAVIIGQSQGKTTTIAGSVFAGGRGYRNMMLETHLDGSTPADINDRSSCKAGWVLGNTSVTVNGGTVEHCVYGGGEGLVYHTTVNGAVKEDEVAAVQGNASVTLNGGTVGFVDNTHKGHQIGHLEGYGCYAGGRVASVHGYANMVVSGSADVARVFGGNDVNGKVYGIGRPTSGDNAITTAYGETFTDGTVAENVQKAYAETYVLISGNTVKVGRIFGGGNGKYDYYRQPEYRHLQLKSPEQASTYVDVRVASGGSAKVNQVFGGGNEANVGITQVYFTGTGKADTVFAGGNSATATTSALVKLEVLNDNANLTSSSPINVDYLFGGNNKATMNILPDIDLRKGVIGKVYGGGNAGAMTGNGTRQDVFGRDVANLSTYLTVDNNNVFVKGALFGGCNNAYVKNTAFVDVRAGNINELYGGNDVSEEVTATRVDMLGGKVQKLFGGGNGYYNYVPNGDYENVYEKGQNGENVRLVVVNSNGRPFVGSTTVNIGGGEVNSSIYGGGYAGDCRNTHVIVNDVASFNDVTLGTSRDANNVVIGGNAKINGKIFGGGFGDQALLGTDQHHVGNVSLKANEKEGKTLALTELYHVTTLLHAYAYGGGSAGDVTNAEIIVYDGWDKPLQALYGGCWGSDVTGTATVNMYCAAPERNTQVEYSTENPFVPYNVIDLYGGNDFTGNVAHSVLNVYNGRYKHVYGGGNGKYKKVKLGDGDVEHNVTIDNDGKYTIVGDTRTTLRVPNSKYPVLNFYNGTVDSNVFGGGNLGTSVVKKTGQTSLEDYAFIQVNVHGGEFGNDIFAGAAGENGKNPLVYGLKVLNMDGGTVTNSVYGGSQSVNDGYANECVSETSTTRRPSSIMNLVGGYIGNNVYGAGYLGVVNGSVFVNIGKDAVRDCRAYNRSYAFPTDPQAGNPANGPQNTGEAAATTATYADYMPTLDDVTVDETTGTALGSGLIPSELTLNASVYNGANWGNSNSSSGEGHNADEAYMFTTAGFHGGESRIRIDGNGYNTSDVTGLPAMDIKYSLLGSGTSCEGGDVLRDIRILNYGKWKNCGTTKSLNSIQRADSVMFKNVGLTLEGDQDLFSAYPSTRYTITRSNNLVFVGHNTLELAFPAVKVHHLAFRQECAVGDPDIYASTTNPTPTVTTDNLLPKEAQGKLIEATAAADDNDPLDQMRVLVEANNCGASTTSADVNICYIVNPVAGDETKKFSTLIVDNGAYIDVFDDAATGSGVDYGDVKGYGFLRAEDNTQAIVTARCKHTTPVTNPDYNAENNNTVPQTITVNTDDGGFFGLCTYDNQQMGDGYYEFKYGNFGYSTTTYRAWKFGQGVRMRQVAVVAPADAQMLTATNKNFTYNNGTTDNPDNLEFAVAMGIIELPPTDPGNYYVLTGGVEVDNENREMELVDAAFIPAGTFSSSTSGDWIDASTALTASSEKIGNAYNSIHNSPSNTFGLAIAKAPDGSSFGETPNTTNDIRSNTNCQTAIDGNAYFDGANGYATTSVETNVDGANNIVPKLAVYLTYDRGFDHTLMGDVKFTLHEMQGTTEVGTVDVTISISTLLTSFEDQEYTLTAMKNYYDIHTYSRKLILPASMERRSLYLTDVQWEPVPENSSNSSWIGTAGNFALTDTATAAINRTNLSNNTFAVRMMPTEDLSETMSTTLGWSIMSDKYRNGFDISSVGSLVHNNSTENGSASCSRKVYSAAVSDNSCTTDCRKVQVNNTNSHGDLVGILDGRSSAAIDFTLYFNNEVEQEYDKGYRGKVKLFFTYYKQLTSGSSEETTDFEHPQGFTVTLDIYTRDHGDTIYVASANKIVRDGITIFPYHMVGGVESSTNTPNKTYNHNTYTSNSRDYTQELDNKGKEPMSYVRTFKEALKSNLYKEGDVICILDTVYIDEETNFNMHGNNGNPIMVVRYSGSHYQFPGDTCAYRGPLVVVKDAGKFSCHDVIFDGRMISSRIQMKNSTTGMPEGTTDNPTHYVKVIRTSPSAGNFYAWGDKPTTRWVADTLRAVAPVFEVKDGGILTLGDNTVVRNCWNAETATTYYEYDRQVTTGGGNGTGEGNGTGSAKDGTTTTEHIITDRAMTMPGSVVCLHKTRPSYTLAATDAYQYTSNPRLIINDNLTIENNLVGGTSSAGTDVHTGAIHLEGGVLEIGSSAATDKKITIVNNYALPISCTEFWSVSSTNNNIWTLNETYLNGNSCKKANVYLHHVSATQTVEESSKTSTTDDDPLHDEVSAFVSVNNDPTRETRIGISKEFPGGPDIRDTMMVARTTNSRPTYVSHAKQYDIFVNDDRFTSSEDHPFFCHGDLNANTLYFQRCATFQKQTLNSDLIYYVFDADGERASRQKTITAAAGDNPAVMEKQQAVLKYTVNQFSSCPDGYDSVEYSVHGGFYPYTYQWSWKETADATTMTEYRKYTTADKNVAVNEALLGNDFSKATAANSDQSPLYGMSMPNAAQHKVQIQGSNPPEYDTLFDYSVTATDLAGCQLTKNYQVKITFKSNDGAETPQPLPTLALGSGNAAWDNTDETNTATATRKYRGLYLNAEVVPACPSGVEANSWNRVTATYETGGTGPVTLGNNGTRLCPGDVLQLNATPRSNYSFLQWDFDPYDRARTSLVMPNLPENDNIKTIMAYFGPEGYWKNHVDSPTDAGLVYIDNPASRFDGTRPSSNPGIVLDYYGNVHVYTEEGLAWLISMANGLNGEQIRTFYADTVFIHGENTGGKAVYDMREYLWTPVGASEQHPFRGVLTTPETSASTPGNIQRETVTIKGIIVNEPQMDNVGFFGFLRDATIDGLNISYSVFRGQQYVGGIAAQAVNTTINNSSVQDDDGSNVTLITGNHTTGGIVGSMDNSTITITSSGVKFMGEAIYNGGVAGYAENGTITNNNIDYQPHSSTLYNAGVVGFSKGTTVPQSGSKSRGGNYIVNNYVRFDGESSSLNRAGGLVGYVQNSLLANNYVYGQKGGATLSGALGSVLGTGVHVENCFYEQGFDSKAFGFYSALDTTGVTSFSGSGSNVILTDTLGSNANLTRQLNKWVKAHGDTTLNYWHSDTENENNGYPVFGEPEYQPVAVEREVASCDRYTVEGILCTESGTYQYHAVDSTEFTDSTVTLHVTINYSEFTELTDTVAPGEDYQGYGFHLTATEIALLRRTMEEGRMVTVVVSDTLQTLAGCDSVVILYLTVGNTSIADAPVRIDLKVYPNPTTKYVTVEGTGLQEVEVYDGVSRRLSTLDSQLSTSVRVDLEGYPAGAYYLRIRTEQGTVIQKVIKR